MGFLAEATGVATIAGPLNGGGLVQAVSWQWIFWVNVPVGVAAGLLVLAKIDESHGPHSAVDLPGMALAAAEQA